MKKHTINQKKKQSHTLLPQTTATTTTTLFFSCLLTAYYTAKAKHKTETFLHQSHQFIHTVVVGFFVIQNSPLHCHSTQLTKEETAAPRTHKQTKKLPLCLFITDQIRSTIIIAHNRSKKKETNRTRQKAIHSHTNTHTHTHTHTGAKAR